MTSLHITPMAEADFSRALPFVREIIAAGETYALPRDMTDKDIQAYFFRPGHTVFRAENADGAVVGVYYLRANQEGGGGHIANAGFMVDPAARGQGVARAMAAHALQTAERQGFKGMQFNFVVSTNAAAVHLWKDLGFQVVGAIPKGFCHPSAGFVDALILYRDLP